MAGRRLALLIANGRYMDPKLGPLNAAADAKMLAEVLQDPRIGGFEVIQLFDAGKAAVENGIERLLTDVSYQDMVLIYFSCHGIKDFSGRLVFANPETNSDHLASTGTSAEFVRDQVDRSRAGSVAVWLDCCYGGAFPAGMTPKSAGTVDVLDQLPGSGRGRVVMTASTRIQYAYERGGITGSSTRSAPSVFTSAIVHGLRTGDADLHRDGRVDSTELYHYVHEYVTTRSSDQEPTRTDSATGAIYIARSHFATSTPHIEPLAAPQPLAPLLPTPAPPPPPTSDTIAADTPPRRSLSRRTLLLGGTGAVLSAGGAATWLILGRTPPSDEPEITITGVGDGCEPVAFSPDGKMLAISDHNAKRFKFWDLVSRSEMKIADAENLDYGGIIAFTPAGQLLHAIASKDKVIQVRNVTTNTTSEIPNPGALQIGGFNADATLMGSGYGSDFTVWRISDGKQVHRAQVSTTVNGMAFAPTPSTVALLVAKSSMDNTMAKDTVMLLDYSTGNIRASSVTADTGLKDVRFSQDGTKFAVIGYNGLLQVADAASGAVIHDIKGLDGVEHNQVRFSPNSKLIATCDDELIRLWNAETGESVRTLRRKYAPLGIAFTPTGSQLASVDGPNLLLWKMP